MTPVRVSIVGAIASLVLILVVVELVRGRRLKERYALLWLATGLVLLFYLKLRRRPGLVVAAIGLIVVLAVVFLGVP